ncbi:hypothetical protein HEP87_36700 [Streptomyces sp. S1D4-11]|nr:hypothetical protein [Streptomyces sp. S1D4-11]QIY98502.1 hypothetical protein HEP87_36700 [Streptomyces sp. S1D4-11]
MAGAVGSAALRSHFGASLEDHGPNVVLYQAGPQTPPKVALPTTWAWHTTRLHHLGRSAEIIIQHGELISSRKAQSIEYLLAAVTGPCEDQKRPGGLDREALKRGGSLLRVKTKSLAMAGAVSLGILAFATPNAQAASKSVGPTSMLYNPNCKASLYIDDHTYSGKLRAQASAYCTKGDLIVTPSISFFRDGTHIIPSNSSIGPRIINKDKGFGYEVTTSDKAGTQCYKARLTLTFPDPADVNRSMNITTPCLNT